MIGSEEKKHNVCTTFGPVAVYYAWKSTYTYLKL